MLTKNFARIWGHECLLGSTSSPITTIDNIFHESVPVGTTGMFYLLKEENLYLKDFNLFPSEAEFNNFTDRKATLMVGSSSQKESASDVTLIEPISKLTPISISSSYPNIKEITASSATYLYNINKTYKNETDKNIIVNEIGLFGNSSQNINNKTHIYRFLLARKVLDTPIIFKPNDIYTVSLNLDI